MATKPDLTEFFKLSRPRTPPCKLGPVLAQLDPADRVKYEAANDVDQNIITNQALALWLQQRVKNISLSWQNCLSHRARKCSCFDD